MSVVRNPATPAVTKTIVVTPATPETYTVTLTRHQLLVLGCLAGTTAAWDDDGGVFDVASKDPLYGKYKDFRNEKYDVPRGLQFKDLTAEDAPNA